MSDRKRVAILISGRGSNMNALIEAARAPDYPAEIAGVISNRAEAEGLVTAGRNNIPTAVVTLKAHGDKQAADAAIHTQLAAWDIDIVCLAGFMRLLGPAFCEKWAGRLLNIHPSLLPDYPGLDTHARALADDVRHHGCTVHFVTAEMDAGPIVGQVAVPVEYGDTPSVLADRVLKAEHKLYPWALAQVASGAVRFEAQKRN